MLLDSKKQTLTLEIYGLSRWADGFFTPKRAEGLSPRTHAIYREKVSAFVEWCQAHGERAKLLGKVMDCDRAGFEKQV